MKESFNQKFKKKLHQNPKVNSIKKIAVLHLDRWIIGACLKSTDDKVFETQTEATPLVHEECKY